MRRRRLKFSRQQAVSYSKRAATIRLNKAWPDSVVLTVNMALQMAIVSTSRPSSQAQGRGAHNSFSVADKASGGAATPSLRSAVLWMLAGRLIYNASQFAVLAVLLHFGTTTAAGHFVLGLAVTAPIVMFCNLQLRIVLATDIQHQIPFADYLAVRNVMAIVALVLISIAAMFADSSQVAMVIVAVGISKLVESISDIHYGRLQRANITNAVSRSLLIRGLTTFITSMLACALFPSAISMCAAITLSGLIVLFFHDGPASIAVNDAMQHDRDSASASDRLPTLLNLVWKSLPLAAGSALMSLEANVPRYVIAAEYDANLLAVVGIMTYALAMGQTLAAALCYPAIPRLAAHFADGRIRAFLRLIGKLCAHAALTASLGVAVALIIGRQMLLVVLGEEFASYHALFVTIVAAAGIQVIQQILLCGLRAMRRFRTVSLVQLSGLLTTAAVCLGFTRLAGVEGIGWALVVSFSCGSVVTGTLIWNVIRSSSQPSTQPVQIALADPWN
jgi:O-antigen/teichoic acid export membrane protein